MTKHFRTDTPLDCTAKEAFAWHERPGAFERLSPPWEDLEVVERSGGLQEGGRLVFRVRMGPIWKRWVAHHYGYESGRQFCDRQLQGPFASWEHRHRFEDRAEGGSVIRDEVQYRLPFVPFSNLTPRFLVEDKINAMFAYRRSIVQADLARHLAYAVPSKRVAITGASGLVGRALTAFLGGGGHTVVPFARGGQTGALRWDAAHGIDAACMADAEGLDAVIHLAGESVLGLWTDDKKRRIRESRTVGTRRLCESLAKLERKPKVLISASAIGYYGDTGDQAVDESGAPGEGFLPEVAREWEAAAQPAREAGIRVVHVRIGLVLSPQGGALRAMLPAFRVGVGGPLGNGRHYMSWIGLDDLIYLFHHALMNDEIEGPLNGTAPNPVTNREFTAVLAKVLGRPAFIPAPAALLRLAAPEIAREMLLVSQRVLPNRAIQLGFRFQYPTLEGALRHLLGRNAF